MLQVTVPIAGPCHMTPDRWRHVKRLFHEALTFPPEARDAFLTRACSNDSALRASVVQLLESHEAAAAFLEASPVASVASVFAEHGSLTGSALGPYRVGKLLGAGGMGEVYEGADARGGSFVAIKVVPGADPEAQASLRREARHAAALSHPHICKTYEVGESEAGAYVAMELVDGERLGACIPPDGWDPGTVLGLALQIAEAVAHAHGRGIKHGDLKSANVMLTKDQQVKVLDFGLARRLPGSVEHAVSAPSFTDAGAIAGTLTYLAPEVLRGVRGDARTDVWAFGILLHEMLTGHQPFDGRTPFELTSAILNEPPPNLPANVPTGLRIVRDNCLAKNPAQRYDDARELVTALEAVRAGGRIARRTRSRTRRGIVAIASAAAVLIGGVVVIVDRSLSGRRASPIPALSSLAVLPFENDSGNPGQDYFADGLTEGLIARLGNVGSGRVIARTSVMQYRGSKKTLPEISRELKVDVVLHGSVAQLGDRVRLTASLVEASTGRGLWTETYQRSVRDVLALQNEIARAVAASVEAKLSAQQRASLTLARAVDPLMYEAFLKGRYYWNMRTAESLQRAIGFFQAAIARDPTFGPAHAALADCYSQLGTVMVGTQSPRDMRPRAQAEAIAALQIDDTLAEAHATLGYVSHYDWEWTTAEREFRRAIELNPNGAISHVWYANYLASRKHMNESIAEVTSAQELDPFSLIVNTNVGWVLYFARRYEDALRQYERTLRIDPSYVQAHWRLGTTYAAVNRFDDAVAELDRVVGVTGRSTSSLAWLGLIDAVTGKRADAEAILGELLTRARDQYVTPAGVALIYAQLRDRDRAFGWLEKAFEERSNALAYLAVDPMYDPLRGDPRFDNLLRRVRLEEVR